MEWEIFNKNDQLPLNKHIAFLRYEKQQRNGKKIDYKLPIIKILFNSGINCYIEKNKTSLKILYPYWMVMEGPE